MEAIAAVCLFVATYLATFFLTSRAAMFPHWCALISAVVATIATIMVMERGRPARPRWVGGAPALHFAIGVLFATIIIASGDLLILATTPTRHARGSGFPLFELVAVFLPAAVHEELVFRGYLFGKLAAWHRAAAYTWSALVFAALHMANGGVTPVAFANLALAGVLLGLARERSNGIWLPIGIHLAWNLMSGAVLGYPVSGYVPAMSVVRTLPRGPEWLTGGGFGMEGSVWMLLVELAGIGMMRRQLERHE